MQKVFAVLVVTTLLAACSSGDWRTASREPAGIAPDPSVQQQAVIEGYADNDQ